MRDFFDNIEGWFKTPVTDDLSPRALLVITVLLTVVVIWTIDGYRIINRLAERA